MSRADEFWHDARFVVDTNVACPEDGCPYTAWINEGAWFGEIRDQMNDHYWLEHAE